MNKSAKREYLRPAIEIEEMTPSNMICLSWGISGDEEGDVKAFITVEDIDEEQEKEIDDSWLWD